MSRRIAGLGVAALCVATAPPALAAPPLDPPARYTVKPGDTLYDLGRAFFTAPAAYLEVQRANRIADPRHLRPGRTLTVPGALLRSEPIEARVVAFSGPASVDAGAGPRPPRLGMAVTQGAVIATGANAFITLEMPDESRITLPSQSRLRIQRLRRVLMTGGIDRVFAVEKGRSESVVAPLPNPDSRYLINTPVASSAVRGTAFRVAFDAVSGRASTEVIRGAVAVADAGNRQSVVADAGYGAAVDRDGAPVRSPLLPAPQLPGADRVQDGRTVEFAVPELPGAQAYRLQLANDAGFIDIIQETETRTRAAVFGSLPDGAYFVRATAIDTLGLEGLPAAYAFTRELNLLEGGVPAVTGGKHDRRYLFRWTAAGAGAKTFRFQLFAEGGDGAPLVDQPRLAAPMTAVSNLPAGAYRWRVIVSTSNRGRYSEKTGELQALQVGR